MASDPILNSGLYFIRNLQYGAIRDDEGALGAKGNSKDNELEWQVARNQDSSYTLTFLTGVVLTSTHLGPEATPGGVISEIEKRFYISTDETVQKATWRLQPILTGSNPPIAFVIYQPPNTKCPDLGHWELNSGDKKEPVKLNRDPNDEENKPFPILYSPNALWIFQPIPGWPSSFSSLLMLTGTSLLNPHPP